MIYPASDKQPYGLSAALLYLFREALDRVNVVVVAGYSFADHHIVEAIRKGLRRNGRLRLLICDPNAKKIRADLFTRNDSTNDHERAHICCTRFGDALSGVLHQKLKLITATGTSLTFHPRRARDLCWGRFDTVRFKDGDLYVTRRSQRSDSSPIFLLELDSLRMRCLRRIHGDIRDICLLDDTILAIDTRLANSLVGLGGIWHLNMNGRNARLIGGAKSKRTLLQLALRMRGPGSLDGLKEGVLDWPTHATRGRSDDEIFVLEAGRVVQLQLSTGTFTGLPRPDLFNAAAISAGPSNSLLVLEHVFGNDISARGLGAHFGM